MKKMKHQAPNESIIKKILPVIFVILFFLICLVPGLGIFIFPKEELKANQSVTAFPKLNDNNGNLNTAFFTQFQDYFSQNFALRQDMITANSGIMSGLFATSNTDQVILGKEDYLFYSSSSNDFLNIATMTERDVANAAISLSLMQEYCESKGMKFLFTIAPNKSSLYPQFMPYNYRPTNTDGNLELMSKAIAENNINYLDLFALFDEQDEILYHKLDSHWNNKGAALVENNMMDALGLEGTDYSAMEYETKKDFAGDLYAMLYPMGNELDYNQYYGDFSYQTDSDTTDTIRYAASNPGKQNALMMYRDSFGNSLIPFMAEEFGESLYSRAVPYDLDMSDSINADCLVIELVERNLANLASRAAIMAAPEREIEIPEQEINASLSCSKSKLNSYVMLSGKIEAEKRDAGTRIYAVLMADGKEKIYEASPVGANMDGSYTLYVPESAGEISSISLIITSSGSQYRTETIDVK